jgi:hypothetical protein
MTASLAENEGDNGAQHTPILLLTQRQLSRRETQRSSARICVPPLIKCHLMQRGILRFGLAEFLLATDHLPSLCLGFFGRACDGSAFCCCRVWLTRSVRKFFDRKESKLFLTFLECGDSSPLCHFSLLAPKATKSKRESGEESPHSKKVRKGER